MGEGERVLPKFVRQITKTIPMMITIRLRFEKNLLIPEIQNKSNIFLVTLKLNSVQETALLIVLISMSCKILF